MDRKPIELIDYAFYVGGTSCCLSPVNHSNSSQSYVSMGSYIWKRAVCDTGIWMASCVLQVKLHPSQLVFLILYMI